MGHHSSVADIRRVEVRVREAEGCSIESLRPKTHVRRTEADRPAVRIRTPVPGPVDRTIYCRSPVVPDRKEPALPLPSISARKCRQSPIGNSRHKLGSIEPVIRHRLDNGTPRVRPVRVKLQSNCCRHLRAWDQTLMSKPRDSSLAGWPPRIPQFWVGWSRTRIVTWSAGMP